MSNLQKITLVGEEYRRVLFECEWCGCPFFRGETVFESTQGHGEVYCGNGCYQKHQRSLLKPEPPQGWESVQC